MNRYVCVHGHFYQPPRENPWLETIELQESAYPYHDWNERITAEAYGPLAASRILDGEGRIVEIVNVYSRISFNFGPTVLSWMQEKAPKVYEAILQAESESAAHFGGHGSATAQAYNHMIMPLANRRDKITQIRWGIADFRHRFGREPEGMWLPETAVDLESLDLLAEHGIKFTVLAPYQAQSFRKNGEENWTDATGGRIDPRRAYRQHLESGRHIDLFFYDGPISRAVAFENLLNKGENLASRLVSVFSGEPKTEELVHIATDGETYGHHHRFGDMALAYALKLIEERSDTKLINYAQYLEGHQPDHEVRIYENTAWSCAHGVDRWRADCGCNSGMHGGWNQKWRAPLREALDWFRDTLAPQFETRGAEFYKDPWVARDEYIDIVLDRSPERMEAFFKKHASKYYSDEERVTALELLEMQRHAMLMYTSCGWFFDDLSGIETVQVLQYAGRVAQLAKRIFGGDAEETFLTMLEKAQSNLPDKGSGRDIYNEAVKPAMVDAMKVGAHFIASSLFQPNRELEKIDGYRVELGDYKLVEQGKSRLAVGRGKVSSRITTESAELSFGAFNLGDHTVSVGVKRDGVEGDYATMKAEIEDLFSRADFPGLVRAMDRHFGEGVYSLKSLFKDERTRIVQRILETTLSEAEQDYRRVYERNAPLIRFLADLGIPQPHELKIAAEYVLNVSLQRELGKDELDEDRIKALVEETEEGGVTLDTAGLARTLELTVNRLAQAFEKQPDDPVLLDELIRAASVVAMTKLPADISKAQNSYYELMQERHAEFRHKARKGDKDAEAWIENFRRLGELLYVRPPED